MTVISVKGLRHSVTPHFWSKRSQILHDVSFDVSAGEIFGFLGPNGAGKTTTIKAMLGLLKPEHGDIRLFGGPPSAARTRRRIGFLPERAYFPEHLTGRELVVMHGLLAGLSHADTLKQSESLIARVGLDGGADKYLRNYSKGMLQRIALAQAVVGNPELVIFDEPMSGLDPLGRADVRRIMLELKRAGTTVFFSTHILPDAETICDRVAIVVGGRTTRVGKLADLTAAASEATEIQVRECPPQTLEALTPLLTSVERRPDALILHTANLESANKVVDALRHAQVTIIELQTERTSLEQLFIAEAKSGARHAS